MSEEKEYVLKLLLLGDAAVGKTSLINMYLSHSFKEEYHATLGVNIVTKDLNLKEINAKARLIFWDLAGQEKYNLSQELYFQGVSGAFLVYDITRDESFKNIKSKWLADYNNHAQKVGSYILIGNKVDLEDSRQVSTNKGEELANQIKAVDFIETSAKYGDNVEKAFQRIVYHILKIKGIPIEIKKID